MLGYFHIKQMLLSANVDRSGHINTVLTTLESYTTQNYFKKDPASYSSKTPTFLGENTPLKSA